ncbi:DUF3237 domain-containing protein [Bradyrhizobium sp. WSM 1738]|uniref:DUF3237 domain-containing protein n=1 Tax=Bradyrhizobium hereditatis TaxID=2821405 RepID=UPI001CE2A752|nr:DUF3237 domain-containing protein [Bradyrhizobium hereditatis]MCA6114386.1 DUF3237 domain-containing protein [Bradyrhizobium hereditatis]
MIHLEKEMTYRVKTSHPLGPTYGSPRATLQYWQVAEAELSGPRIKAQLAATGLDWMQVSEDGFWRPNVRAQFLTHDGAVVLMSYIGLVEQTASFKRAAEANEPTDWDDQYMRLSVTFNTGDARYAWMNQSLFIAAGRLLGTGHIEYSIFRIT